MEFIIMDAFLVILLLYVFLFIRKIVRLVIRLVKRPGAEEKVVETRVISRRTAENAQSKAEAAKALLAACRKSTNPIKLIGWLFGGRFGKMAGMFKWLFRQPLKLVGFLSGLIRRKKKDASAATSEAAQPIQPAPAPTYEPNAEPLPAVPPRVTPEVPPLPQHSPAAPTSPRNPLLR